MIQALVKNISNLSGWRSNRKIIVFESDDWGSMRFPDKFTRDKFIKDGYPVEKCWMSYNDIFESSTDIECLLTELDQVKDRNGRSAKFTFLFNPANPDYDKIRNNNFESYHYKSFDQTLLERDDGSQIKNIYKEGLDQGILEIAFHGREHLYVNRWLRDLKKEFPLTKLGFENRMWGFSGSYVPSVINYRAAFDLDDKIDLVFQEKSIKDGINLIEKSFDIKVYYFLAPDGPFHLDLIPSLSSKGVQYIGLSKIHLNPQTRGLLSKKLLWLGKTLPSGLKVITRNAIFEPSSPRFQDWIGHTMKNIESAFRYKKPAVISSHRANYVSGLEQSNRELGLLNLRKLLKNIITKWPDVEFMTSTELGNLMSQKTPNLFETT